MAGTPCSEPASGTDLTFQRGGRVVARDTVAKDGSYSVSLAAGTYVVVAVTQQMQIGRGIEPSSVRVAPGQRRKVDFTIDTGIR